MSKEEVRGTMLKFAMVFCLQSTMNSAIHIAKTSFQLSLLLNLGLFDEDIGANFTNPSQKLCL